MEEKYQGDFFEVSDEVGIDLNTVIAIKGLEASIEVFTNSKELSKTFITDKQKIQSFIGGVKWVGLYFGHCSL